MVEVDEEDHIVPQAADPVHNRHLDDKGKQVVDEGVEGLVGEHAPGQVGHRLELVVDEELGCHGDEAEGQQEAVEHAEHPGVPALVLQVQEAVDGVAAQQREEDPGEVPERHVIVHFG